MANPNLMHRFVVLYFVLWFLSIFKMFGALIVLLEYVNKRNMLIASLLMSNRRHLYRKTKAKRISQLRRKRREISYNWWQNLLNGSLSKNFRLTQDAFFKLEKDLRPFISPDPSSPNHRAMSAAKN